VFRRITDRAVLSVFATLFNISVLVLRNLKRA
jgi:hypothetical protein